MRPSDSNKSMAKTGTRMMFVVSIALAGALVISLLFIRGEVSEVEAITNDLGSEFAEIDQKTDRLLSQFDSLAVQFTPLGPAIYNAAIRIPVNDGYTDGKTGFSFGCSGVRVYTNGDAFAYVNYFLPDKGSFGRDRIPAGFGREFEHNGTRYAFSLKRVEKEFVEIIVVLLGNVVEPNSAGD